MKLHIALIVVLILVASCITTRTLPDGTIEVISADNALITKIIEDWGPVVLPKIEEYVTAIFNYNKAVEDGARQAELDELRSYVDLATQTLTALRK